MIACLAPILLFWTSFPVIEPFARNISPTTFWAKRNIMYFTFELLQELLKSFFGWFFKEAIELINKSFFVHA